MFLRCKLSLNITTSNTYVKTNKQFEIDSSCRDVHRFGKFIVCWKYNIKFKYKFEKEKQQPGVVKNEVSLMKSKMQKIWC